MVSGKREWIARQGLDLVGDRGKVLQGKGWKVSDVMTLLGGVLLKLRRGRGAGGATAGSDCKAT